MTPWSVCLQNCYPLPYHRPTYTEPGVAGKRQRLMSLQASMVCEEPQLGARLVRILDGATGKLLFCVPLISAGLVDGKLDRDHVSIDCDALGLVVETEPGSPMVIDLRDDLAPTGSSNYVIINAQCETREDSVAPPGYWVIAAGAAQIHEVLPPQPGLRYVVDGAMAWLRNESRELDPDLVGITQGIGLFDAPDKDSERVLWGDYLARGTHVRSETAMPGMVAGTVGNPLTLHSDACAGPVGGSTWALIGGVAWGRLVAV